MASLSAVPNPPNESWPPLDLADLIRQTGFWGAEAPGVLTREQLTFLLRALNPKRVEQVQGGSRASYLPTWDVEATLNRIFGFGNWDRVVQHVELVYERTVPRRREEWVEPPGGGRKVKQPVKRNGEDVWDDVWQVGYRATVQLVVRDLLGRHVCIKGDVAMGLASGQADLGESHDLALKTAVSTALKRCAKALGDQFGLSLYDSGNVDAKVGWTFAAPPLQSGAPAGPGPDGQPADSPA